MKIIERWKKSLYRKAVKHRLIAPQVIVLMDGGVCSQMHQYLLGRIFENGGHKVLYDLSFYEEWGTDMDYQFVRNFDLLKAFPYLKVKSASKLALSVYKKKYFNLGNNTYGRQDDFSFLQKKPPVYLGGYYHVPGGMVWVYKKRWEPTRNIIGGSLGVLLVAYLISEYVVPFNLVWVQWGLCALVVGYLVFLSLSERHLSYFLIGLFALGSIGFLYSSDYFFNKVLEPHQQIRIKVVLGMEEDLAGAGCC